MTNFKNSTLYIGITNDIKRRVYEHKNKLIEGFAEKYNIYKLVYLEEVSCAYDAITREKQLKGWTRKRKEELIESINPTWQDLMKE